LIFNKAEPVFDVANSPSWVYTTQLALTFTILYIIIHLEYSQVSSRILLTLAFLLCVTSASFAMRCQQSLVYEGDTKYLVVKKCGEPLAKEIVEEPVILYDAYGFPYGTAPNTYEVWTYQRSPTDFLYELTFQDGVVKSIKSTTTGY
jgi:hypothetical protein